MLYKFKTGVGCAAFILKLQSHLPGFRFAQSRNLNLIHKQPAAVTLLVVPCILGVNLTDVDLLESLEQVYELETSYLQETGTFGNALKGFETFLSTTNKNANLKRSRKFQLEDRLFSLSSVTSPAAEELGLGREDGRPDPTQDRLRGGGFATNGQGKPKKGRTGARDGRKFRISNDLDLDDEDPDSGLR